MWKASALVGLSAVFLAWLLYFCFWSATSKLPSAPGPLLARFTRFWYLKALIRGDFEQVNIALHRKYGKIVRLEPGSYSIDDPEAIKTIYTISNPWVKSSWYGPSCPPGTTTNFSTPDNKDAARYRRNYAQAFAMSSILAFEPLIDECGELLIEKLKAFAKSGETVDLTHWFTCWAFDCQGHITFSERFGFLDKGEDIGGICESLRQRMSYAAFVGVYPELHPTLFKIVNWLAGTGTGKVDYTISYTVKRIAERNEGEKLDRKDMLAQFLAGQQRDPTTFTDWDVLIGAFGNIVAGADTTWITLSAIVYYLLKNRRCLDKLRKEIDEMAKAGSISDPISFHESQSMPYCQAVIKEGQRLYPGTGLPLFRVVPKGGAMIAGTYFPEGAVVGINNWVAHHNKDVFGPDPDVFRPERWLEGDTTAMNRYYIPFGVGPRACQGLNVALMEMSKFVPQLVRHLDFDLLSEWKTTNRWLMFQSNINVKVKLRD
ncbi:uncharacterized protein PV07_07208 [Cladophialophora immunda]|uniref:Cytochrome P450 oxidoreductase n=1 Tax=Cladophialophora immunda TaxID=569365 RepID=A0A0D2CUZ8_9EURO|nr:uncharacterized protein PV07_07208 [Cladophialophora immunda]KIW27474.1 hypothetical protein PV07_07208 [Cladophialophora immunda]OQV04129.1 hypothetical protein CLAIMM_09066 isoform 2 [Cladophialophora immunda]